MKIVQTSACAACEARKHCNASESKEKVIDVYCNNADAYEIGENVLLRGENAMGMKAVLLAFFYPFLLLMAVLVLTLYITDNEPLSALLGLLALVPYYWVLYRYRDKMKKKFRFTISKKTE